MYNLAVKIWASGSLMMNALLIGVAVYILIKVISMIAHGRRMRKVFEGIPGPKDVHWFYGNLHLLPQTSHERLKWNLENCNKYPRYYRFFFGAFSPVVVTHHPDTAKMVLKTSEPKPTGAAGAYRFGLPWLGEGLLIASGQRWARARRLLTPAFHFDILKPYTNVYNEAAQVLLNKLEDYHKSAKPFEVFSQISLCTLDIILRCAFSYDTDCQRTGDDHPYVNAVRELAEIWWYRGRRPYLHPDLIFYLTSKGKQFKKHCDTVHKVAEDVIGRRRKTLAESQTSQKKYLDFLDILLTAKDENGVGMTPLEIRNEVDTFLFEGHDTTASAISWILFSLAEHGNHQRKAQEEIDAILKGRESDEILWDDLPKFEYLTMCIKEGMRLHTPVPFIQRQFTHDFELDGRIFPKETVVSVNVWGLHHNKYVWDEPMEFRPERFSKENVVKMDTYQFVPFSAGPRNCIGQHFAMNEEKIVLARLLRRFSFRLDPDHVVRKHAAAVMRAENGIMMFVDKR